jgi:hypothetical protein
MLINFQIITRLSGHARHIYLIFVFSGIDKYNFRVEKIT